MNRNATKTMLLALAMTLLAACASTGSAPPAPDPAALDMNLEPADRIPSSDDDFDGAEDAAEALGTALQENKRNPWHRFTITGSIMLVQDIDTSMRVGSKELGIGTELDFEDLLGLDDQGTLFRFDFLWRINRTSLLGFSWYDITRSGDVTLRRDIEIGDDIFPAGAQMETKLGTEIFRVNYWWNFVTEEDYEFGVGIGIYWMRVDASFRGRLAGGGEQEFDESFEESVKVDFPPPLLGLRGAWAITDRLRLSGSLELLYVPIDAFEGWIVDARLGLDWDILNFMGLGVGYNYFNMGVEADMSGLEGDFDYTYHALLGSLYFYW